MKISFFSMFMFVAITSSALTADDYGAKHGGYFKIKGKGYVALIDCRQNTEMPVCQGGIAKIKDLFNIDVKELRGVAFTIENARIQFEQSRAAAAIFVVDIPSMPISLAAAEEKWALINIGRLDAANSDAKKIESRTSKLFVREFCFVLGSDKEKSTETCFYPSFNIEDLDKIQSLDVTMSAYMAIGEILNRYGLEPIEYGTYQDACELGIAPPPTNELQKVIWDKVHAIPKNPIKIEFDPKKGR